MIHAFILSMNQAVFPLFRVDLNVKGLRKWKLYSSINKEHESLFHLLKKGIIVLFLKLSFHTGFNEGLTQAALI